MQGAVGVLITISDYKFTREFFSEFFLKPKGVFFVVGCCVSCFGFHVQQRKQVSGFYYQSWSKEGTVRHRQSKEASILWSHHEETRELPGERDNARNNARCTQARKAAHGLEGQHQDVDWTLHGRVSQNNSGQR